jgi:hypothetical protein
MRKLTILLAAITMASLLAITFFFVQPSTARYTVAPGADLYAGMALPYAPVHALEPLY